MLEFDKVKHNITSEELRIYDELVWHKGGDAVNGTSSDFVMSETNQCAELIIFNPSEPSESKQRAKLFTLNVMSPSYSSARSITTSHKSQCTFCRNSRAEQYD